MSHKMKYISYCLFFFIHIVYGLILLNHSCKKTRDLTIGRQKKVKQHLIDVKNGPG